MAELFTVFIKGGVDFFAALAGNSMVPISIVILVGFYLFKNAIRAKIEGVSKAGMGDYFLEWKTTASQLGMAGKEMAGEITEVKKTIPALSPGRDKETLVRTVERMEDIQELVLSAHESATTAASMMQPNIMPPPSVMPSILHSILKTELNKRNTKIENFETKGCRAVVSIDKPINAETTKLLLLIADKFGYILEVNWSAISEG